MNKLLNQFQIEIQDLSPYKTPGIPGIGIQQPKLDEPRMSDEKQKSIDHLWEKWST